MGDISIGGSMDAINMLTQASASRADDSKLKNMAQKFSDTLNSAKEATKSSTTKSSNTKEATAKKDADLKKECDDFESVLVKMMLTSMRKTVPKDTLFDDDSNAMDTYQDMLDDEYAKGVSKRGIGISDVLYKQLSKTVDAQQSDSTVGAVKN